MGVAVGVSVVLAVGGCSSGSKAPSHVYPAAYGEQGHCYYVSDPAEVGLLQRDGRCPRSSTALLMPLMWRQRYAYYYDRPAYYTHYVPQGTARDRFVDNAKAFEGKYRDQIKTQAGSARYVDSKGKVFAASKVGPGTFGGGSKGGFGGGSRQKICGLGEIGARSLLSKPGGGGFRGTVKSNTGTVKSNTGGVKSNTGIVKGSTSKGTVKVGGC